MHIDVAFHQYIFSSMVYTKRQYIGNKIQNSQLLLYFKPHACLFWHTNQQMIY